MNPVYQRCALHRVTLIQRESKWASKAASGLWCPEGHWAEAWDVVDKVTDRVVFRATKNGGPITVGVSQPVTVLVPRWACQCARCGHTWVGRCDCMPMGEGPVKHLPECEPPTVCAGCSTRNWQRAKGA